MRKEEEHKVVYGKDGTGTVIKVFRFEDRWLLSWIGKEHINFELTFGQKISQVKSETKEFWGH